jgi:hypothetical protein
MNIVIANLFAGRAVITETEMCKALCISRRTAFTLRKQRKIGYFEDGRLISYGPHHIVAYLSSRERFAR